MASTGLGGYGFGLAPLFPKGAGEIWLWVPVSQGKARDLTGELARVGEQGEGMGEGGGRNMSAIARQMCTHMDVSVDSQRNHVDCASPGLQLRLRRLRMRQFAAAVVVAAVYAVADAAAADVLLMLLLLRLLMLSLLLLMFMLWLLLLMLLMCTTSSCMCDNTSRLF